MEPRLFSSFHESLIGDDGRNVNDGEDPLIRG